MEKDRHLIPFQLDAEPTFEDIGVAPLGHVASSSAVELVAVKGSHSEAQAHDMTSKGWVLHTFVTPPRGTLSIDGGREFTLPRFTFLPPGAPIRWRSSPCIAAVCNIPPAFMQALSESESHLGLDVLDCVTTMTSKRLTYLGQQIFREAVAPAFGATLVAEAIATEIAVEIARCNGGQEPGQPSASGGLAPWQMRQLEDYVRCHLADDLSLQALAAIIGISQRHLSRVMMVEKGMSVHAWVSDIRIGEARRLLSDGGMPVRDIASRIGFKSAAAFSTAFRRACGLSPTEYRQISTGR